MKNRYLSNPEYNFDKVNRASMACGPMVKWAIAQVHLHLHLHIKYLNKMCIFNFKKIDNKLKIKFLNSEKIRQ